MIMQCRKNLVLKPQGGALCTLNDYSGLIKQWQKLISEDIQKICCSSLKLDLQLFRLDDIQTWSKCFSRSRISVIGGNAFLNIFKYTDHTQWFYFKKAKCDSKTNK